MFYSTAVNFNRRTEILKFTLQVFDQYVKTRAEEERKEKKNKTMQAKEDFRKMMEEAKLNTRWGVAFCCRFGRGLPGFEFDAVVVSLERLLVLRHFVCFSTEPPSVSLHPNMLKTCVSN